MASAKGALKDKLGHSNFLDEIHATTTEELSYESYKGNKKPIDARSDAEVALDTAHQMEDEARKEFAEEADKKQQQPPPPSSPSTTSSSSSASASASAAGTAAASSPSARPMSVAGYHSVATPLSDDTMAALTKLKDGSATYVQLLVDKESQKVNAADVKSVGSLTELQNSIHTSEPRFYVYKQSGTSSSFVFIYSCPDKSPPKLRMLYSTSKTSVADQIAAFGITLASKRIEIREGSDLADEFKGELNKNPQTIIRPTSMPPSSAQALPGMTNRNSRPPPGAAGPAPTEGSGTVKARNVPTIGGGKQHPIYTMLGGGSQAAGGTTTKKKIVMPPPGAWQ